VKPGDPSFMKPGEIVKLKYETWCKGISAGIGLFKVPEGSIGVFIERKPGSGRDVVFTNGLLAQCVPGAWETI